MIKLKLGNKVPRPDGQPSQNAVPPAAPPPPQTAPTAQPALPKLKLHVSQPPTPVDQLQQPAFPLAADAASDHKKRTYQRKQDGTGKGKKRAADDDTLPPVAKRIASGAQPARRISLKPPAPESSASGMAKPRLSISAGKRKTSVPKLVSVSTRGKIPVRQKGVGYDSEDSDVEKDPAIQQALVLRMEDGEDANYLRDAIANGKIGEPVSHGGAEVSIKFLEKNLRRALIKIRGRMYGAVLVDLPCIVESMKSFDKKGWWKVADIAQMLLVLGRCNSEEEARTMQLPREVNKDNFQYAHGLTPPMRWARKRRFRKRISHTEATDIDEQVAKLIQADREWETTMGGKVESSERRENEQSVEPQGYDDDEDDAEDEAVETVEMDGQEYEEDDEDDEGDDDLAAQLGLALDEDDEPMSELIAESPAPMADQAASMVIAEQMTQDDSEVATPIGTPAEEVAMTPQQQSSDEESDEDEDDPDEYDEDAMAKAAERAQQMEEVGDLEREVFRGRERMNGMTNQLLRQREAQKVIALEEELTAKKRALGLEEAD